MSGAVPLVELVRGGLREGVHFGSAVLLGPDGSALRAFGDVTSPMYPRSTLKPAQVLGMLRAGLELPDEADLALAAASHDGEAEHTSRALAILHRHGLDEHDLRCPPDWPGHEGARAEQLAAGSGRRRIAMNCSGKHAAMLATCVQRGWSTEDYLDPEHPLQRIVRDTVSDLAGEPIEQTTVDGCGAPLFAISLSGLARLFRALVDPVGEARRVADAMRAHPWQVAGSEREDTELMTAVPGLLAKSGAEGVLAMALPDGRAVAAKLTDGAARGRLPLAVGALRAFGIGLDAGPVGDDVDHGRLRALAEGSLLGGGEPVGTVRLIPGALG